jgi:hypothetical protein
MSSRETLMEAMGLLADLGCLAEMARGDDRLLIVTHDDREAEVRRVVDDVDPAARQAFPPEAC